jgi:hypothetical protein
MGLDCTHGFWNGSYGAFMRWRTWLAAQAGIPLSLMEGVLTFERDYHRITSGAKDIDCGQILWKTLAGFRDLGRPIPWAAVGDPLKVLLHHSDCNGRLRWWDCKPVGLRLLQVIRQADDDFTVPLYTGGSKVGEPMWTRWQDGRSIHDGMVPATKRAARGCLRAYQERVDIKFR